MGAVDLRSEEDTCQMWGGHSVNEGETAKREDAVHSVVVHSTTALCWKLRPELGSRTTQIISSFTVRSGHAHHLLL